MQTHIGIKGEVTDKYTGDPIQYAVIQVTNMTDEENPVLINHDILSGMFWFVNLRLKQKRPHK